MSGFNRVNFNRGRMIILQGCMGLIAAFMLGTGCPFADADGDGVADTSDNCVNVANANQANTDGDALGDACDNCPDVANDDQANADNDSAGDACDLCSTDPNKTRPGACGCGVADTDSDGDGKPNCNDNCTTVANADQADANGNGVGTACEPAVSASAGADATVEVGQVVALNGSGTGEAPLTFSWVQTSGPAQTLGGADSSTASVTGVTAGAAEFQLTVTDTAGRTATDAVTVTVTPGASSLVFTTGTDNLTGTANADTFSAFLAPGSLQTLNTGDIADGLGGADVLNGIMNEDARPNLAGIETINLTAVDGSQTLNASNITGATTINSVDSEDGLTVENLAALMNGGLINPDASEFLEFIFDAAAVAGTSDSITLTVERVTAAGSDFDSSGIETLAIISNGSEDNILTVDLGADLKTINVSGAAALDLGDLGVDTPNVKTLNASAATGAVKATAADTDFTFTGGSGDDRIAFNAGQFDDNDSVDGGAPTSSDTLAIGDTSVQNGDIVADAITAATGIEILELTDGGGGLIDVDADEVGSIARFLFSGGGGGDVAVEKQDDADTFTISADRGELIVTPKTDDFSNTLNVTLDGDTATVTLGTGITATDFEFVNLTSDGTDGNDAGTVDFFASGASILTITGTADLTVAIANQATVTATAFGGKLEVTGSGDNDTITGSPQADTIDGGAGADTSDGGAGKDTYVAEAPGAGTGNSSDVSADLDKIVFVASQGDIIDLVTNGWATPTEADLDAEGNTVTNVGAAAGADLATALATATVTDALDAAGDIVTFTNGGKTYLVIEDGTNVNAFNVAEDYIVILSTGSDLTGFGDANITGTP